MTLATMLERGDDENRWDSFRTAEVTGYGHDVKVGGIKSANCHAKDAMNRDTHVELVLDPGKSEKAQTRYRGGNTPVA